MVVWTKRSEGKLERGYQGSNGELLIRTDYVEDLESLPSWRVMDERSFRLWRIGAIGKVYVKTFEDKGE